MAGIYIHVPFCKQACLYCNFHFKAGNHPTAAMTQALIQELTLRKHEWSPHTMQTLYLGGGTPSLLPVLELEALISKALQTYSWSSNPEITLEVNPDDLSPARLKAYKGIGINRLSIGVQSFNPQVLKWMNRAHNPEQAINALNWAYDAGFNNVSADLIVGSPMGPPQHHETDIKQMCQMPITHLSVYNLTLEPQTAWDVFIKKKAAPPPQEDKQARALVQAHELLQDAGWIRYELSNFARAPQWFSKHNSNYWNREPYLGIGPSAHSFDGRVRRWNLHTHTHYLQALKQAQLPPSEEELITPYMAFNEIIMTGLRTQQGVALQALESLLPKHTQSLIEEIHSGLHPGIVLINNHLVLKKESLLFTDSISSNLMVVQEE